jgi:hypothetical protein
MATLRRAPGGDPEQTDAGAFWGNIGQSLSEPVQGGEATAREPEADSPAGQFYQDIWAPPQADADAQSGETPREREAIQNPNSSAVPRQPSTPNPQAGATMVAPGSVPGGVLPFKPLSSPSVGSMATPRLRGLYGAAGGLQGGGLGVPQDPVSNQLSNPIDQLLELFTSKMRTPRA